MKNLKQPLKQPLANIPSGLVVALFVIAILGFADATYLTVEHFLGVIPPCSVTQGCEKVLTSAYSTIFGIPDSLLGSLYYLAITIGSFIYLESKYIGGRVAAHHVAILKWTLLATGLGALASLWFLYLQIFVLHAYCIYCLGSAASSLILHFIAHHIWRKNVSVPINPNENI